MSGNIKTNPTTLMYSSTTEGGGGNKIAAFIFTTINGCRGNSVLLWNFTFTILKLNTVENTWSESPTTKNKPVKRGNNVTN